MFAAEGTTGEEAGSGKPCLRNHFSMMLPTACSKLYGCRGACCIIEVGCCIICCAVNVLLRETVAG